MEQITDEQQKDIDDRIAEFRKRHLENVEELQADFISYPQFVQIGPGMFGVYNGMQLVDKKYAPIPSPLANDGNGNAVEADTK